MRQEIDKLLDLIFCNISQLGIAIYDFDGHELIDNVDYTAKWRYIEGLPFSASKLQNSVASFDNYLVVAGDTAEKEKKIYYFDVHTETWYDTNGEIPLSEYKPATGPAMVLLCK